MILKPHTAAGLLLTLAGCSWSGAGDYGQLLQIMRQSWHGAFQHRSVTLKEAAAVPYASMGWRLNSGDQNLIVLATETGSETLWTSRQHIVLLLQDGHIKQTVGLPQNLSALSPRSGTSLVAPSQALKAPYSEIRTADFPDLNAYAVSITCKGRAVGSQPIVILGKTMQTSRVDESCECKSLNWSFQNRFWVDSSNGFVWRSSQGTHPGITIDTEILRPPG